MSATLSTPKTTSGGEIIRELVNASDGQGLHCADAGYIDLTNAAGAEFGASDFSIEFILDQDGPNVTNNYIWYSHTSGNNRVFVWHSFSAGVIYVRFVNSAGSNTTVTLDYDMSADYGTPTHYALSFDRDGDLTLYKNGNNVASVSIAVTAAFNLGDSNASVGRISANTNYSMLGTFYRFRTWNKSLSQAEVTASYENATVPFADQWGSQTNKFTDVVDTNWGIEVIDAAGFNAAYDWTSYLTSTIAVNTSNVLTFTTNADGKGIWGDFGLTAGKRYRFTMATGAISGATYQVQTRIGSDYTSIGTLVASTTNTFEFTAAAGAYANYLYLYQEGAGTGSIVLTAAIVTNELVAAGCVADYDLAFANQKQSLVVEDRSGSSDTGVNATGMMSASGVTQVTPIEQLNSKSARIGTSAATPADGELLVSGNAGVGGTAVTKSGTFGDATTLGIVGTDGSGNGPTIQMAVDTSADARPQSLVFFNRNNADSSGATVKSIAGIRSFTANAGGGTDGGGNLKFYTKPEAGNFTERLTIDSAGLVQVGANTATDANDAKVKIATATSTKKAVLELRNTGGGSQIQMPAGVNQMDFLTADAVRLSINGVSGSSDLGLATFSAGIAVTTGGIKFPQPQSASADANTLDDYEEGVWAPLLTDGTNNATMNATYNFGKYTRIGDVVTLTAYVVTSSLGSVSGNVRITGIPFAAASGFGFTNGGSVGSGGGLAITAGQALTVGVGQGSSLLYLRVWDATTGSTEMQESEWTADGNIQLTITYKAA